MKNIKIKLVVFSISCAIFYLGFFYSYSYFSKFYLAKAEQSKQLEESKQSKQSQDTNVPDMPLYEKEVFLTFDDGPSSNNTSRILKILKQNNVKATFFIIGANAKENPNIVKEMYNLGMSIEPHTYSHDYNIYKSIDTYFEDLDKCTETIKEITGKDTDNFVRLPGGSDNLVSNGETMKGIRKALIDKGIYYVDWNVSAADASAPKVSMDKILNNVLEECKNRKMCVVLMHDAPQKTTTVDALPYIIEGLRKQGFVFRTFDEVTPSERQQMIKQEIINR